MGRKSDRAVEMLTAAGCIAFISLLGYYVMFGSANKQETDIPSITKNTTHPNATDQAGSQVIQLGLPTTAELVRNLVGSQSPNTLSETEDDVKATPSWLITFESLAGNVPLDGNRVTKLLAFAETIPDANDRMTAYAMIADQADPKSFHELIWPKLWDASMDPDISRIIANTVPKMPEDLMFSYLVALLQHHDEETRSIARGVLWGYFPDVRESDYPRAVQYRNQH
jgi:hypothetical protein